MGERVACSTFPPSSKMTFYFPAITMYFENTHRFTLERVAFCLFWHNPRITLFQPKNLLKQSQPQQITIYHFYLSS